MNNTNETAKNSTTQIPIIDDKIPAIACTLKGGYLIEASAGTGKTWTLTGILLRLLVEKRYPPERIIATTFTRAAASEMQERLQLRLSQFYRYLQWLMNMRAVYPDWFDKTAGISENEILSQIITEAKKSHIADHDDPINIYLLFYLLKQDDVRALDLTLRRLSLLLATLDKLFIGTLDSLAQKLLKEFSAELSYQMDTQISADSDELTRSLIHDELRYNHQQVVSENPALYNALDKSIFGDIDKAYNAVDMALQFYGAQIDEVPSVDGKKFAEFSLFLDEIVDMDLSGFEPYYEVEFATKNQGMKINTISKNLKEIPVIISTIKKNKTNFLAKLPSDAKKLFDKLGDIDDNGLFKRGFDDNRDKFHELPILTLKKLYTLNEEIIGITKNYQSWLYQQIAERVKLKLKQQLEQQNQSTFTFQMVRLIDALRDNIELARHIRYLYPVALIDESQDINGLQSDLIRLLYLDPMIQERKKEKKGYGFLLLVGDPKQAIYRFRGGDVANYNFIKHYGENKESNSKAILNYALSLTHNRRSHQALIKVLNQWFIDNGVNDRSNHAHLGDDIYYKEITAVKEECQITWQCHDNGVLPDYLTDKPLTLLSVNDKKDDKTTDETDKYTLIAEHINGLLQDKHTIYMDEQKRAIVPSDIAVLSRTSKDLMAIKKALAKLSIAAITPKDINVFSTKTAKEIYQLLLSVMLPKPEYFSSLLMSSFFNLSLSDAQEIIDYGGDVYTELIIFLKRAGDIFHHYGIASMLNFCLLKNPLKKFKKFDKQMSTLWENIAIQGERYMSDFWQLSELMSIQQSVKHVHETHFLAWFGDMMKNPDDGDKYKQLVLPSETGVNLLTIHRSKGLEYPIVYIFGLDEKPFRTDKGFYLYSDNYGQRHLSPVAIKGDKDYKEMNVQEEIDELRRLAYVALTRASEQCFVVFDHVNLAQVREQKPLLLWLEQSKDKNKKDKDAQIMIEIPERLKDEIGHIFLEDCQDLIQTSYVSQEHEPIKISYDAWEEIFKKQDFVGAITTSATALMGQLSQDDEYGDSDTPKILHGLTHTSEINYQAHDIRVYFKKGTDAGTFLHRLLQLINPNDRLDISKKIDALIKTMGLFGDFASDYQALDNDTTNQHDELVTWIENIAHVPMVSGVNLANLQKGNCAKELSFTLGLDKGFNISKLNEIFRKYSDKSIFIEQDKADDYYKFLKGEIDLIYEYDGRFYVVDYKSNFISERLSDYQGDNLELLMHSSGYWLQACVYQVALHRLLKLRVKDYIGNETKYLGEVEFIFLRGVDKANPTLGRISWDLPIALVLALDELFGN